MYKVNRLTEEGKAVFSWQFDETQNMDDVRCVTNLETGEIILAVRILMKDAVHCHKINPKVIETEKGIWKLWHDGYDYCICRMGDR